LSLAADKKSKQKQEAAADHTMLSPSGDKYPCSTRGWSAIFLENIPIYLILSEKTDLARSSLYPLSSASAFKFILNDRR
jgi:hypothetical protein